MLNTGPRRMQTTAAERHSVDEILPLHVTPQPPKEEKSALNNVWRHTRMFDDKS